MTHCQLIIKYLLEHDFITTMDAFGKLRITRLSARVHDLKEEGIELGRVWRNNKNTRWLEYHLDTTDRERAKRWLKDGCLQSE